MTLGERLQKLRKERGLSQDQVAEQLDVSRQAVSKWERDEAVPEIDKIIALSRIFSVSTDYILKDEVKETIEPRTPLCTTSRFVKFIKTKWYFIGYVVGAWGIWDFANAAIAYITLNSVRDFIGNSNMPITRASQTVSNAADTFIGNGNMPIPFELISVLKIPMTSLWILVVLAAFKIIAGIIITVFGKKHCIKKQSGRTA